VRCPCPKHSPPAPAQLAENPEARAGRFAAATAAAAAAATAAAEELKRFEKTAADLEQAEVDRRRVSRRRVSPVLEALPRKDNVAVDADTGALDAAGGVPLADLVAKP